MGVLQRMKEMTKASVHELLDKMEDPVIMLNQYLRDMEEEIAKAEVTVAKQLAHERRLLQRLEETAGCATPVNKRRNSTSGKDRKLPPGKPWKKNCTMTRNTTNSRKCTRPPKNRRTTFRRSCMK